ncbi:MAG: hypothetical protein KA779_15985, partial [Propionivibrio sp.]|nr:hypothetical protein [Propionivibrio sp.]
MPETKPGHTKKSKFLLVLHVGAASDCPPVHTLKHFLSINRGISDESIEKSSSVDVGCSDCPSGLRSSAENR